MEDKEIVEELPSNAEESALLKEYQKLKENTVSKEKYEKDIQTLKEKNEMYLRAITEGEKVDAPSEEDSGSVYDTIARLSKFKGTNLDYWKETTKAIDQTVKALGNEAITKTIGSDGLEELIEVKEVMSQMVEDSQDDPDYFRTLYKARVKDSAPNISASIEKAGGLVDYFKKQQK